MQLTSPTFQSNQPLPDAYTCKGKGVSPPLQITQVPANAQGLVLIMHDPDAVGGIDFLHWAVWNIPPGTADIAEGRAPAGAVQGTNDYPGQSYGPACPPAGTGVHHYIFDLYALDSGINLQDGASRQELERAMQGHVLAQAQLVGIVTA